MKLYESSYRTLSFAVVVNGKKEYIHFEDSGAPEFVGRYYCSNEDIAKAIEASPYFGTDIRIASNEEPHAEEPAKEYAAVYEDVKRTQEANKILVNNYGVDKENLTSKADALRIAEELNISFPNL